MRKLLEQANKKDLIDFLEECMREDIKLANRFRARFAEPEHDDTLDRLEKKIDDCMDNAENCRDDWGSMVLDTSNIRSQIKAYIKKGHFTLAFSALELMLQKLEGLLEMEGKCEVSDEISDCVELMEEIADEVDDSEDFDDFEDSEDFDDFEDSEDSEDAKDSNIKDFLFEHCLELVLSGYGDDYDLDASDNLLGICVRFVTQDNRSKIEKHIETKRPAVYLDIVRRLDGQKAVDDYIQAHLDNPEIIKMAYEDAMSKKDYAEAEKLLNAISDRESGYNKLSALCELYSLHELTGSTSKMIEAARIILSKGDAEYYPKLKALLQASGEWEEQYKQVLEVCQRNLRPDRYMKILKSEGELAVLVEQLKKHQEQIYVYGGTLAKSYRGEIQQIFTDSISDKASRSTKREEYRDVADRIKIFSQAGYATEAKRLIQAFVQTYRRRSAFVEELEKIGKELGA